jgi:hypothetical protein
MIIKNTGYAPGLALGRYSVSGVSHGWLQKLLLYEYLLLVLFDHLVVLLLPGGHELHQLILCMHAMMMQQFSTSATSTLKTRTYMLSY